MENAKMRSYIIKNIGKKAKGEPIEEKVVERKKILDYRFKRKR